MTPTRSPSRARAWLAFLSSVLLVPACRGGPPAQSPRATIDQTGDLFATRPRITVEDTVPGDVMLVANVIVFRGHANGDYLATADRQSVAGHIGGSARAVGRQVRLSANIGRNATIAGGLVQIDGRTSIGQNAYLAGQEVRMGGVVRGNLQVTGRQVVLDGTVDGNVNVDAERLRVGPNARIGGNLLYRVPREHVTIDPGAQIRGRQIAVEPSRGPDVFRLAGLLISTLGFLAAGAAAVLLFPRWARAAAEAAARRPIATTAIGLLLLVGVPIVATIVAITIIGIPLALILMVLYAIALYLARVVPAVWIGRRLLGTRGGSGRAGAGLAFLIGAVILLVVGLIPILGGIVTFLATLMGLGALIPALRPGQREGTAAQPA
jgi:cytoskeletal protein CcmA (bactofilin family)